MHLFSCNSAKDEKWKPFHLSTLSSIISLQFSFGFRSTMLFLELLFYISVKYFSGDEISPCESHLVTISGILSNGNDNCKYIWIIFFVVAKNNVYFSDYLLIIKNLVILLLLAFFLTSNFVAKSCQMSHIADFAKFVGNNGKLHAKTYKKMVV